MITIRHQSRMVQQGSIDIKILAMILYIGKGNIKDRLKSPERKEWDICKVEYSLITDRSEMSKYESFHLKEYENKFNKLPEHNIISA